MPASRTGAGATSRRQRTARSSSCASRPAASACTRWRRGPLGRPRPLRHARLIKTRARPPRPDLAGGSVAPLPRSLDRFSDNLLAARSTPHPARRATTSPAARAHSSSWACAGWWSATPTTAREKPRERRALAATGSAARRSSRGASRASTRRHLKKQGLLALPSGRRRTTSASGRATASISSASLGRTRPAVECRLRHAVGSSETLWLAHSYSEAQLEWFRRGSALNCVAR